MMAILILLYALVRWGSGREIAGYAVGRRRRGSGNVCLVSDSADLVGGSLLRCSSSPLAAIFRSRADLWQRRQREIRNEERLALARELHDTVAHHVSAIAVQAQAGGVVARAQPAQAAQVLATIEAEATRTLSEMRAMVRVLREDGWGLLAAAGVADPRLARADATPDVAVSLTGAVTGLPGPVDAAVYRIARQEAVTNALRHAPWRHACRHRRMPRRRPPPGCASPTTGLTHTGSAAPPGFGLTGMTERAQLLAAPSRRARRTTVAGWWRPSSPCTSRRFRRSRRIRHEHSCRRGR